MNFIEAHDFSVDLVLRVLGIASPTYYGWRARRANPGPRARADAELLRLIDTIRGEHPFAATYGSPRVWLQLRRRGVRVGRKRVERIMRVNGRRGAYLPKGWKHGSTWQNPKHTAAPDLLGRDFSATAPNTKWVGIRSDPHPHRRGGVVAGQRARCVFQQGGWLGQWPPRDHRAGELRTGLRDLVPRRA